MRKWRDMERQMAPSSQTFSQGGIRSSDWFSDRLKGKKTVMLWLHRSPPHPTRSPTPTPPHAGCRLLPVQSVAHLNGDEHGQRHGHRVRRLEHVAVQALKLRVVRGALEEVALWGGGQDEGWGGGSVPTQLNWEEGRLTSWYKVT